MEPVRKDFIPFSKPSIGEEEIKAVTEVLRSGWVTSGPKSTEFEENFKKYIGTSEAISVYSCTAALHTALLALGIKGGDEVITSTFTFISTVHAIEYVGATPVLIDIQEDTFNINPDLIEKNITPRTRAIIVVHYGGHPCDMDKINTIAKKHNLYVIEDAAHAIGTKYKGRSAGNLGDIGCFSFYANKNMTTGEGGMITLNNKERAILARRYSYLGIKKNAWERYLNKGKWFYEITELGYKYNLSDISASIGIEQLKKIDRFNKKRRELAEYYSKKLKDLNEIILPIEKPYAITSWYLYPIRLKDEIDRDRFIEQLGERNVGTSVHFIPIHHHPYSKRIGGNFPVADRVYKSIVSLPLFYDLSFEDVDYITNVIKDVLLKMKNG